MRVLMAKRFMAMPVGMRLRHRFAMKVSVVLVVEVTVFVFQDLMLVFMLMPLGQMQPKTTAHQQSSQRQLERERLAEKQDCDDRSDERRQRKISSCPRCSQVSQSEHE